MTKNPNQKKKTPTPPKQKKTNATEEDGKAENGGEKVKDEDDATTSDGKPAPKLTPEEEKKIKEEEEATALAAEIEGKTKGGSRCMCTDPPKRKPRTNLNKALGIFGLAKESLSPEELEKERRKALAVKAEDEMEGPVKKFNRAEADQTKEEKQAQDALDDLTEKRKAYEQAFWQMANLYRSDGKKLQANYPDVKLNCTQQYHDALEQFFARRSYPSCVSGEESVYEASCLSPESGVLFGIPPRRPARRGAVRSPTSSSSSPDAQGRPGRRHRSSGGQPNEWSSFL